MKADMSRAEHQPGPAQRLEPRATAARSGEAAAGASPALSQTARRANAGPHASSLAQLQSVVAQRACADCETVKRTMGGTPVQRARDEGGGLPGELRAGLEHLSGLDLAGVSVNYDSPRPARLNAHAVAQGPVIDVAPGQERHLPHEGWHAVQQMQNRVRPTMDLGGTPVNDDAGLEREADVMGARALAAGRAAQLRRATLASPAAPRGRAPVQRLVDLDQFLTKEDLERLDKDGVSVDDLKLIQKLLRDESTVGTLMGELESETEKQFWGKKSERKYTTALNLALFDQEKKWMDVEDNPKDREKIKADEGQLDNDTFLGRVGTLKPLKDVGAAISHGEYAHRMQWYMISRVVEKSDYKDDLKPFLQKLYKHMADPTYTKMFKNGKLLPTDKKSRTAEKPDGTPLPLWSAILDIQGSNVDKGKKKEEGYEMFGDVFAAAPVKLTGALTFEGVKEPKKGSMQQGGMAYSQVSLAVLNRRIKRFFDARNNPKRPDGVMKTALENLAREDESVRWLLGEPKPDYDQRNEIAFKLLGIPWE